MECIDPFRIEGLELLMGLFADDKVDCVEWCALSEASIKGGSAVLRYTIS